MDDYTRAWRGLFAGLVLLLFAGCPKPVEQPEARITVPLENDIQTLDPAQLSDPFTSRVVWQIYEGLVGLDNSGQPVPLLAESWSHTDDYRVWRFHLRKNVRFHDSDVFGATRAGRVVRAEDVRYSYERIAKGFGSFVFAGLVEGFDDFLAGSKTKISGFVAVGDSTFEVRLTRADPAFLYRITSPYLGIMPHEAVERGTAFGRSIAVGTGPFQLLSRTDTDVTLVANLSYWKSTKGNLKSITFRVDKNDQIRTTRIEQQIYALGAIPVALQPRYFDAGGLRAQWRSRFKEYRARTFNVHYLGIENKRVSDVHLRRAIAHAVDKRPIVSSVLRGTAVPADELVPPNLQGFQAPGWLPFDVAAAKEELAKSTYNRRPLVLLVSDISNEDAVAQLLQSQLAHVGIQVTIQKVDMNTFISRLFSADRPDLFLGFSEWVFSAPELILESYQSTRVPNPNVVGYSNPGVDALLARLPTTADRSAINSISQQVSAMAAKDAPLVPLYHLDTRLLVDRRLSDFEINGHQYWNFAGVRFSQK